MRIYRIPAPVAAFSFRGECRIDGDRWAPPAAFTGLRETLRAHEHCREHAVLLATFTPVGAAAFLRPSLEEFSGTTTDLAGVLGSQEELGWLSEQLAGAQNRGRRTKLLEDFRLAGFLFPRLIRSWPPRSPGLAIMLLPWLVQHLPKGQAR